ncbi:cathepsin cpc1 [Cystoisospora suis]|uniref:Dipeptidyl peptidase 1 n=1 Tax=Cystoisospora suis TaxID=483139 RepID=A0A2C6KEP6_9APIC|nr:cathepsin cpc1 [Cystoisospora suis]
MRHRHEACSQAVVFLHTVAVVSCLLLPRVGADLPVHATLSDIKGDWRFHLSPPVTGAVNTCGSPSPNTNTSNLRDELKDYGSYLEKHGGIHSQLYLSLTDKPVSFASVRTAATVESPHRASWKALGVFDTKDPARLLGSWTTVYDEGFEVDVGGHTRLMGIMKYSLQDSCTAKNGDLEDSQGKTKCYATDPTRTHIGWYISHPGAGGALRSGCFFAEKIGESSPGISSASFVVVEEASVGDGEASGDKAASLREKAPVSYLSQDYVNHHNASPGVTWRAGVNSVFANMRASDLSRYIKNFGFKKLRRGGELDFQPSFVQSSAEADSAADEAAATQIYACPCKRGEKPLDTREMENTDDTLMVLSPVSALQLTGDHFLASINAHGRLPEVTSESGSSGEAQSHAGGTANQSFLSPPAERPFLGSGPRQANTSLSPAGSFTDISDISSTSSSLSPIPGEVAASSDLPKEFSWSDPFHATAFDEEVTNQGGCGSCYAVAATYALQKRFEIAASRMLGRKVRLFREAVNEGRGDKADDYLHLSFLGVGEASTVGSGSLSAQSVLSCSFYNQGCDGGFPYLVGKHARDIGIPQATCMSYQASHEVACPFQTSQRSDADQLSALQTAAASTTCAEHARWYAKDYGYVGGCYECNQCSGERQIMEEVYHHGPVAVALDAAPSLFAYNAGIYDTQASHARVCDNSSDQCSGVLTGWEYTNHAVTIVGWGESEALGEAGPRKYWIVRNTWGPDWGTKGYMKLARGKNLGGIESQATFMDPDFTRGQGLEVAKAIAALKAKSKM